jgi:hypothetical protein
MTDGADAPPERTTTVVVVGRRSHDRPGDGDDHRSDARVPPSGAATAAEGLAAVLAHRPDVVVLDYILHFRAAQEPAGRGGSSAPGPTPRWR